MIKCNWSSCNQKIEDKMWGCKYHWFKLPAFLRNKILAVSNIEEYIIINDEVQKWIKEHYPETKSKKPTKPVVIDGSGGEVTYLDDLPGMWEEADIFDGSERDE